MTDIMLVLPESFSLQVKEVIREFVDGDHLFLRVSVLGPYFPHRASAPFVRIVNSRDEIVESLMAEVSSDQKEMRGYFPTDTELAGRVEFGYASQVMGSVPVRRLKAALLDAKKVSPKVHRVTGKSLGPFKPKG